MKKLMQISLAGILALSFSTAVYASSDDPMEKAAEYRHDVFEVLAWHFGKMGAMIKGKVEFDKDDFATRANYVAALSAMPWEGFVEGSQGDSDSKAEIWTDKETFDNGAKMLQEKVAVLVKAAESAEKVDDVKPAFMDTAKLCKGCHKKFKKD